MKSFIYLAASIVLVFLIGCDEPHTPPTNALESRVRHILELPTAEHVYRDVVYFDEERSYLVFKTRKAVLFAVDVHVEAGIDLATGFKIRRTGFAGITVTLPPARILSIDADETTIREYFVEERFDAIARLDYYDELDRSKTAIREDALSRGILSRAEENAKGLIRGMLRSAGYEYISFETVDE